MSVELEKPPARPAAALVQFRHDAQGLGGLIQRDDLGVPSFKIGRDTDFSAKRQRGGGERQKQQEVFHHTAQNVLEDAFCAR